MFCSGCGKSIKDGVKFCTFCGKKVPEQFLNAYASEGIKESTKAVVADNSENSNYPAMAEMPVDTDRTVMAEMPVDTDRTVMADVSVEQTNNNIFQNNVLDSDRTEILFDNSDSDKTEILFDNNSVDNSPIQSPGFTPSDFGAEAVHINHNGQIPMQSYAASNNSVKTKNNTGKEKKGKAIAVILIVVLILALIGGGIGYFIFSGKARAIIDDFTGSKNEEDISDITFSGKSDDEVTEEEDDDADIDEVFTGKKKEVDIQVSQVDNVNFPEVSLYASIRDKDGVTVEDIEQTDLVVKEISETGDFVDADIVEVYKLVNSDNVSMNLVLDQSGSMDGTKMTQAKSAAKSLVDYMSLTKGDQVEIISFDDYVYLKQEFTSQSDLLYAAIDGVVPDGSTALYDALYAGVYQTYYEKGAKCVIGFTDGEENASSYSYDDVVEISKNTGIPVYIIGIGDSGYNSSYLTSLADECGGRYYSADENNLETILEEIYKSIYDEQKEYYVVKYTSKLETNLDQFRDVVLETSDSSEYSGTYTRNYIPKADVTGAFSGGYADKDYILPDSNTKVITSEDLKGLSLAELRIARNEIFARHGRQFKDPLLNQWFYSKSWYLDVNSKYSPDDFAKFKAKDLTNLENENATTILQYENNLIASEDIYPNAANVQLSEYDLALTKETLKKALKQMDGYASTPILEENKKKVREAIDAEEIKY